MNFSGTIVAFIASTDVEGSRPFYRDLLGLDLLSSSPHADIYDCGGTQLRVTAVGEKAAAPYTVLGWDVDDLDASVEQLRSAGVVFNRYEGLGLDLDDHDAWTAPDGTRVAWFNDPDANVLSLAQHASNVG